MEAAIHCFELAEAIDSPVTVTKPTSGSPAGPDGAKNAAVGDLLVIISGNDNANATPQHSQALAPSGFTFIDTCGDGVSDSHVGMYIRVVDGTEGASFQFSLENNAADVWAGCILVSGVSAYRLSGTKVITDVSNSTLTAPGVTTPVNDCLAFGLFAYEGDSNDYGAFTITGTGWTELFEVDAGEVATPGDGSAGVVAYKKMPTAGPTSDVTATGDVGVATGMAGFQLVLGPPIITGRGMVGPFLPAIQQRMR